MHNILYNNFISHHIEQVNTISNHKCMYIHTVDYDYCSPPIKVESSVMSHHTYTHTHNVKAAITDIYIVM